MTKKMSGRIVDVVKGIDDLVSVYTFKNDAIERVKELLPTWARACVLLDKYGTIDGAYRARENADRANPKTDKNGAVSYDRFVSKTDITNAYDMAVKFGYKVKRARLFDFDEFKRDELSVYKTLADWLVIGDNVVRYNDNVDEYDKAWAQVLRDRRVKAAANGK